MKDFWGKIKKKPFFCLAPMADVTDFAFRKIITKYGKPDVLWTEFVSADGLANKIGQKKLLINLKFSKNEHPIVAQIFGSRVENIKIASKLCAKLGFDGIDINMGCPDKAIEKQGSGASMIKNKELAREIIKASREGAPKIPISVKTRIGYNKNEIDTWIRFLLEQKLPALTIHLRNRKEMSNVPAHWELMPEIINLRNEISPETLIIGNGDVVDIEDGRKKCIESGCDGIMIGRAIFGNPFLFKKNPLGKRSFLEEERSDVKGETLKRQDSKITKKLKILTEHTKLFEKYIGKYKSFALMKKHFKAYVNGFNGAKELRVKLMEAKNSKEVKKIINDFCKKI
ncbi:MAG: tRNA-dihydrouridine synthase [Candidatus Paceibacterota bacterium]